MSRRPPMFVTREEERGSPTFGDAGAGGRGVPERGRRPPALGRWLLRLGLPRGVVAESIAGDLEQEFHARRARARGWYLRQVLAVLVAALRDRIRGRGWASARSTGSGERPSRPGARGPRGPRRRAGRWLADLLHDLRFAARRLVQRPAFTAVAVLTLAIGIGIDTAIFTVADGLLLRPVPGVSDPSRLVEIYRGAGSDLGDVAYPAVGLLRQSSTTLEDVAGWTGATIAFRDRGVAAAPSTSETDPATAERQSGADVAGRGGSAKAVGQSNIVQGAGQGGGAAGQRDDDDAEVLRGFQVTGNYFTVLGVPPALGRFFAPRDSFYPRVADEVVIGYDLWQRRYGGSDEVVGRSVSINGYPARIIGVTPEGFAGHQILVQRDLFMPLGLPAPGLLGGGDLQAARGGSIVLLGRLAEGAGVDAARQELGALGARYADAHAIDRPYRLQAEPYGGIPGTDRAMVALFFTMLMVIVGMVLAIACVNVANMLLSRAIARRRELAIRVSLGAGRGRVVRQLLTESALLFLLAGAAGILLAAWATDLLVNLYLPQMTSTRLYLDVSPDARVLAFALGVAALTALIFGLAPALGATRSVAGAVTRNGAGQLQRSRLRAALVGGQMATALVLLVAAGLMVRALSALETVDLGYDLDGVYSVELRLELAGYDAAHSRTFYRELLDEVSAIPGVVSAATARKKPMASRSLLSGIYPEGIEPVEESGYAVDFNRVSPGYFGATGIPIVAGRAFDLADDEEAPGVAIVNTTMARRLWGGALATPRAAAGTGGVGAAAARSKTADATSSAAAARPRLPDVVGRRFTIGRGAEATSYEVVGIAADVHYNDFVEETPSFMYLAAAQSPDERAYLIVRADSFEGTIGAVRAAVAGLDPDVPVVEVETMRTTVEGFSMGQRLAAWVAGVVGIVGLLLGAVGVYGVTAFAVTQRRHEIGVRMALGARTIDVVHLMLRSGLRAPLAGMVLGLIAAAAAAQLIGSFLYGISPLDPVTYAGVVLLLGLVAAAATLIPARRAAAMDPVETLRSE